MMHCGFVYPIACRVVVTKMFMKLILIECEDHAVRDLKTLIKDWSGTRWIGEVDGVNFEVKGLELPIKLIKK